MLPVLEVLMVKVWRKSQVERKKACDHQRWLQELSPTAAGELRRVEGMRQLQDGDTGVVKSG